MFSIKKLLKGGIIVFASYQLGAVCFRFTFDLKFFLFDTC